jgi:APA family basic amino acid/polyamine antiporter
MYALATGSRSFLEYAMGASTVAVGWSGYAVSLLENFGIDFSPQWADASRTVVKLADGTTATAVCNLPAILWS